MEIIKESYRTKSKWRITTSVVIIALFLIIKSGNIYFEALSATEISELYDTGLNDLCGDLLSIYGEKSDELHFVDCKRKSETGNDQLICEAIYKVDNKHADSIERYLVEKYGMGALRFVCCGWETLGKYGLIESERLRQINSNYVMSVNMYGNTEQTNEKGEIYLEEDRNKINQFIVVVSIHDI